MIGLPIIVITAIIVIAAIIVTMIVISNNRAKLRLITLIRIEYNGMEWIGKE